MSKHDDTIDPALLERVTGGGIPGYPGTEEFWPWAIKESLKIVGQGLLRGVRKLGRIR